MNFDKKPEVRTEKKSDSTATDVDQTELVYVEELNCPTLRLNKTKFHRSKNLNI